MTVRAMTATLPTLLLALAASASPCSWAQQGPGYGIATAPRSTVRTAVTVSRPIVVTRSYPVYVGSSYGRFSPQTRGVSGGSSSGSAGSASRGPFMIGSGQWVPQGAQADALLLMTEPGDTMATPAAPSGHWDWKRASMAELVELSRRNKASRAQD